MENTTMVTIPLERYEQLIKTSARVDTIVELAMRERTLYTETTLLMLGTEASVELSEEIAQEKKERLEAWQKTNQGITNNLQG